MPQNRTFVAFIDSMRKFGTRDVRSGPGKPDRSSYMIRIIAIYHANCHVLNSIKYTYWISDGQDLQGGRTLRVGWAGALIGYWFGSIIRPVSTKNKFFGRDSNNKRPSIINMKSAKNEKEPFDRANPHSTTEWAFPFSPSHSQCERV